MPRENSARLAFNRGVMSTLAAARIDLGRYAMAAEEQTNWLPRVLGSMMLRPGMQYTGATAGNAVSRSLDFVFASDDTARLEITTAGMRVWVDDELVTREAVTAAVTNGHFANDLTGWSFADEAGAGSVWSGGHLLQEGTGDNRAILVQTVTVNEPGVEHALRVVITRGPVTLRVGSASTLDDYIPETELDTGTHSLAFTPAGDFHIRFMNGRVAITLVDAVTVEAAGVLVLPTPWAAADLSMLRKAQSADIIYLACEGYQQRKIERRSTRSWSVALYQPDNGPFRVVNRSVTKLSASALSGNITLTASGAFFQPGHVGALFRLASTGQIVTTEITGEDEFSEPIRVTGVGAGRAFGIVISGTFTATVTLQYSIGEPGSWVDSVAYTVPVSISHNDALDNQIVYYRIGVKLGDFTVGTVNATLTFSAGSAIGVVRITGYTNNTSVVASVLDALGGTDPTDNWSEGSWSDVRGWPSAVTFHDGRLWWIGHNKFYASVSDDYENFDDETEGDAGPIQRSIGEGPVDSINWALSMQRLVVGTASAEISARASSLDEPLTPTAFTLKASSTQGSAKVDAVKVDSHGVFVQKSGQRVMDVNFDRDAYDYKSEDLTLLVPDLNISGITHLAVQRQPDTRIHAVRADGTVGLLVFDRAEEVICWVEVETDGAVEDVVVLPGIEEDKVYYTVRRTIGGATARYFEKWAMESECQGGALNKQADSFLVYEGAATDTITGLDHLNGETVVVWADGRSLGEFTVVNDEVVLGEEVSAAVVGLGYSARFKPMKHAFAAGMGTPLNQRKRIDRIGLVLMNTHPQGIQYGPDFDNLDDLPLADLVHTDDEPDTDALLGELEMDMVQFAGGWDTDTRVCLYAEAPKPVTVLACTVSMQTSG